MASERRDSIMQRLRGLGKSSQKPDEELDFPVSPERLAIIRDLMQSEHQFVTRFLHINFFPFTFDLQSHINNFAFVSKC